jgi:hypothetical protein
VRHEIKRETATATLPALLLTAVVAASAQQEATQSVLHVVFADLSVSGKGQEEHWSNAAEQTVFGLMRPGDGLLISGVHDHTGESAPLFLLGAALPIDMKMGSAEVLRRRKLFADMRDGGRGALRKAFADRARSRETKVIESLGRIRRNSGRLVKAIYFSDMLESSSALNLEQLRLTDHNTSPLVEAAVRTQGLEKGSLAGVAVYCVLNSPRIGERPPSPNTRLALQRFWRVVFEFTGARLEWFDSTPWMNGRLP